MDKEEVDNWFKNYGNNHCFKFVYEDVYQVFKARMMLELQIVKRCEHEWEAVTDESGLSNRSQCVKCRTYGDQYNLSTE